MGCGQSTESNRNDKKPAVQNPSQITAAATGQVNKDDSKYLTADEPDGKQVSLMRRGSSLRGGGGSSAGRSGSERSSRDGRLALPLPLPGRLVRLTSSESVKAGGHLTPRTQSQRGSFHMMSGSNMTPRSTNVGGAPIGGGVTPRTALRPQLILMDRRKSVGNVCYEPDPEELKDRCKDLVSKAREEHDIDSSVEELTEELHRELEAAGYDLMGAEGLAMVAKWVDDVRREWSQLAVLDLDSWLPADGHESDDLMMPLGVPQEDVDSYALDDYVTAIRLSENVLTQLQQELALNRN